MHNAYAVLDVKLKKIIQYTTITNNYVKMYILKQTYMYANIESENEQTNIYSIESVSNIT